MVSMNRVARLLQTDAVALERFDHVPGVAHRDPRREHARTHAINLVEAGSFRVRTTGRWHRMTAGSVLVTTPGLEFSCAHDEDLPSDSCLSVRYSAEAIESARSVAMTAPASTPSLVRPLTNRQAFLQHGLLECVAGDEARLEALADALLASLSASRKKQPLFRAVRLSWYAGRVERAKAMIAARYAERLSLSMLARDAGMSIFHFARVFAELEGQPPAPLSARCETRSRPHQAPRRRRRHRNLLRRRLRLTQPFRHDVSPPLRHPAVGTQRPSWRA